ncbi:MAG: M42 family peptidase [Chloroflexi bacterium]|nr:M42 family peptidase [Chloroflexota bacterium]
MKEELRATLKELTALNGISGYEHEVVRYLRDAFSEVADNVEIDALGNLYATRSNGSGPRLMVSAHSDEIGLMVKSVEDTGFLRFDKIGGVTDPFLPGRKVMVKGKLGVIGARPGHLVAEEGQREVTRHTELYIDVGAGSAAEVRSMGIQAGDPVTYLSELDEFANSDRLCGKSIDNRAGCTVLLQLFRDLAGKPVEGTLAGTVCVQEEVGCRGAAAAAYRVNPGYAVVIDTIPACDTPDSSLTKDMNVGIGRGFVMPGMSGNINLGNITTPAMKDFLLRLADREGIPYQIALFPAATTDAATINLARGGIATGVVNIPRRYSHSPVEVVDLNDMEAALRMVRAVVANMRDLEKISFI